MEYTLYYKGKEYRISVSHKDGIYLVQKGKEKHAFEATRIDDHTMSLKEGNHIILSRVFNEGQKKTVIVDGDQFILEEAEERDIQAAPAGKSKILDMIIKSPMPGSVVKLNVKEGDTVKEGDILIIVEAMKMENELRSPGNLKVKKVYVKEGEQVEGFVPLIELA
jgi:biotin carboxyl carrier protein